MTSWMVWRALEPPPGELAAPDTCADDRGVSFQTRQLVPSTRMSFSARSASRLIVGLLFT